MMVLAFASLECHRFAIRTLGRSSRRLTRWQYVAVHARIQQQRRDRKRGVLSCRPLLAASYSPFIQ